MSAGDTYKIAFLSLKNGTHDYEFEADGTFFSTFEESLVQEASIEFSVELEKLSTLMNLMVDVSGTVETICDRCGDKLHSEISGTYRIVVKFGDETSDLIDDIIVLGPAEHFLNLDQLFYEFTHLCLSQKNIHEFEEDCNQEALEALRRFELRENDELDPRWAQLKKLK